MNDSTCHVHQIAEEISPPESGKQSVILVDDERNKVIAFAFAEGEGLAEHVAPLPVTIQIVSGDATLTLEDRNIDGKPGTFLQLNPKIPHSITAKTPLVMVVMLRK